MELPFTRKYESSPIRNLLELDDDTPIEIRLEHALDQLAKVSGLPTNWRSISPLESKFTYASTPMRCRWCIKWLIEKLNSVQPWGRYVRANASGWILLGLLVSQSVKLQVFEILRNHNFMHILVNTMEENYGKETMDTLSKFFELAEHCDKARSLSFSGHSQILPYSLFEAIDQTLHIMSNCLSAEGHWGLPEGCPLLSLRNNTIKTSRLIFCYVMGLNKNLLSMTKADASKLFTIDLDPLLQMWEAYANNTLPGESHYDLGFRTQNVLPLLILLVILDQRRTWSEAYTANVEISDKNKIVVEYLIVRYVFGPCFADIPLSQKDFDEIQKYGKFEESSISFVLSSIELEVQKATLAARLDGTENTTLLILLSRSVLTLYELMLRVISHLTVKKQRDRSMLLEGILIALAACLKLTTAKDIHQKPLHICISTYEEMLRTTVRRGVKVRKDKLMSLAWSYSGLCGSHFEELNWSLISTMLCFDKNGFVETLVREDMAEYPSKIMSKTLFHGLTRWSKKLLEKPTPEGKVDIYFQEYYKMKSDILQPLISAFVDTRNMRSFFAFWRAELKSSVDIGDAYGASIWEDDVIDSYLQNVLISHMAIQDIFILIRREHRVIKSYVELASQTLTHENSVVGELYTEYRTALLVINALLYCVPTDEIKGSLYSVVQDMSILIWNSLRFLSVANDGSLLYHTWRSLLHLFRIILDSVSDVDDKVYEFLLQHIPWDKGLQSLQVFTMSRKEESSVELRSTWMILSFLASMWDGLSSRGLNTLIPNDCPEILVKFVSNLLQLLNDCILSRNLIKSLWNGSSICISDANQYVTACVALVAKFPQILGACVKDTRRQFFFNLSKMAARSESIYACVQSDNTVSLRMLFHTFCDYAFECSNKSVRCDILHSLKGMNIESVSKFTKIGTSVPPLVEEFILLSPPRLLHREFRKDLSNALVRECTLRKGTNSVDIKRLERCLIILSHIMDVPNLDADIYSDPTVLWSMVKTFDKVDSCHMDVLLMQEKFVQSLFFHIWENIEHEREYNFARKFVVGVESILESINSFLDIKGTLLTIKSFIRQAISHDTCKMKIKEAYIKMLLNDLLNLTQQIGRTCSSSLRDEMDLVINALLDIKLTANTWPQHQKLVTEKHRTILHPMASLKTTVLIANNKETLLNEDIIAILQRLCQAEVSIKDFTLLLDLFLFSSKHLSIEKFFTSFEPMYLLDRNENAPLLACVLREVITTGNISSLALTFTARFSNYLSMLIHNLSIKSDNRIILILLDCVNPLIGSRKHRCSQWGIDGLLSVIINIGSALNHFTDGQMELNIYSRLCLILRKLVYYHRQQLKGRMHLVVKSFNTLMIHLFKPHAKNEGSAVRKPNAFSTKPMSFERHKAESLNLALNTWCYPPTIPLTLQRRKSPYLNDEKQLHRQMASRFAIITVEQYCNLQLTDKINQEINEMISSGVSGMLDMIGLELMQVMSARMDVATRRIWKDLYWGWRKSDYDHS